MYSVTIRCKRLSVFNVSLCFCHQLHFLRMDSSSICFAFRNENKLYLLSFIDVDNAASNFTPLESQYSSNKFQWICNIPTLLHRTLYPLFADLIFFSFQLSFKKNFLENRTITFSFSFQKIQSKFTAQIINSPF